MRLFFALCLTFVLAAGCSSDPPAAAPAPGKAAVAGKAAAPVPGVKAPPPGAPGGHRSGDHKGHKAPQ